MLKSSQKDADFGAENVPFFFVAESNTVDCGVSGGETHHRLRSYPWQRFWFPVTVQHLKGHKSTIYMAQRFSTLVGLSTHAHLHARVHHVCRCMGS